MAASHRPAFSVGQVPVVDVQIKIKDMQVLVAQRLSMRACLFEQGNADNASMPVAATLTTMRYSYK